MMRLVAGVVLGLALAMPAAAQQGASPVDKVYACAGTKDDAKRLACYDEAVGRLKQAVAEGEVTTYSRAEIATIQKEAFGLFTSAVPPEVEKAAGKNPSEKLDNVEVSIVSWREDPAGNLVLTTDTGQVWRQSDSTRVKLRGAGPWPARIKSGTFATFFVKIGDQPAMRAKREK